MGEGSSSSARSLSRAASLLGLALWSAAALQGQDLVSLPLTVSEEIATYVAQIGAEAVPAEVDLDLIRSGPERLVLTLPDGRAVPTERAVFDDRGDGNVLWTGSLIGVDYEAVQLTLHDGYLIAWLAEPGGSKFHLQARPDGWGRLAPAGGPSPGYCPGAVVPSAGGTRAEPDRPASPEGSADRPRRVGTASSHDSLDIVVFHTRGARDNWSRVGGSTTAIQAAFDYLNRVLRNGEIPVTANLVHSEAAPSELDTPVSTLLKLRWNRRAASARYEHGADLVHLFNAESFDVTEACGRAYVLLKRHTGESFAPFGYGWTSNGARCGYQWSLHTFAHEVGHNLGGNHDPANTSIDPAVAVTPFAYGHTDLTRFPRIATVMSYGVDGDTEFEPYFSSVRHTPNGWTIGVAGERENERVVQQTIHDVARLSDHAPAELGPPPPWPPVDIEGRATSSSSVHLTWVDDAHNEAGFTVWYRPVGGEWTRFSVLPADSEEEHVTGLLAGRRYEFAIGAYNNNATNSTSFGEWVTVQLPGPTKPAAPSELTAVAVDNTTVRLQWADNSDDEDGFEVQLRPQDGGWRTYSRVAADTESAEVTELEAGGSYRFRVRAYNNGGRSSSNTATVVLPAVEYTDCVPSAPQVFFDHGYTVSMCVEYEREGETVQADAVDYGLESRESGLLYFFERDNSEVLIKVLDGCAINNHRWVFVAPVTTLAFNLRVDETATGESWEHKNPRGGLTATTKSDVEAFPCGAASAGLSSSADGGGVGVRGVDLVDARGPSASATSTLLARVEPVSRVPVSVTRPIVAGEAADCEPRPVTTLLGGYTVNMCVEHIRNDEPVVEDVKDYGLDSEQSAILYFFNRDNAEVLIKVLDGCAINGHRWVFVAPVTTLAFNLSIESPGGGEPWTHENRLDQTAAAKSDLMAFRCSN